MFLCCHIIASGRDIHMATIYESDSAEDGKHQNSSTSLLRRMKWCS